MACKVLYKASVEKDLARIDRDATAHILDAIREDLAVNPGKDKHLKGEYKDLYSYRIGDYRVVYSLYRENILILRIGHRKDAYRNISR